MPDDIWQACTVFRHYGALLTRYVDDPSTVGIDLLLFRWDREARAVLAPHLMVSRLEGRHAPAAAAAARPCGRGLQTRQLPR